MPSSARILATPPIRASVFFASSDISSLAKRQSGTMDEKILTCFTCPHIITWRIPSCLQISISLPRAPKEIQWHRAANDSISGDASSLMAMATTSMPAWRAASSASTGKRPLPAIIPKGIKYDALSVTHLLDESALRASDELQQFVHFHRAGNLLTDAFHRLRGVESGAGQQPKCFMQRVDSLGSESAALEADFIGPEHFCFALGHGVGERQHVLGDHAVAADNRVSSHAAELMHAARRTDKGPVADGDVAAQRRRIR